MHNWRLLLLAFLAVLQPITSFTERNLVDGREQCCDRNSLLRDSRLTYGTSRFNKSPEDRRLSRIDTREDRRYEVRRENIAREHVLTRPSADRRVVEFRTERDNTRLNAERAARFSRADIRRESIRNNQRVNIPDDRERRIRDTHRISSRDISRDVRSRDVSLTRNTRESVIRQVERDHRENRNDAMSAHRDTPKFRETRDTRREFREIREAREGRVVRQLPRQEVARKEIFRVSEDRRIVRERVEERRARSESNLDSRRERQSRDRRVTDNENQRSSLPTKSMDNIRQIRETSELQRRDSRDIRGNRRQVRDVTREMRARVMSVRRDLREERRAIRDPAERSRSIDTRRDTRLERASTWLLSRSDEARFRTRDHNERSLSDLQRKEYRTLSRKEREPSEMRRAESSRVADRVLTRERHVVAERRDQRDTNRREARDSERAVRMTRSRDTVERDISSHRINKRLTENREREINDARLRSNLRFVSRDFGSISEKMQPNQPLAMNLQYVLYVLQGIYLGGLLLKMLSPNQADKKSRGIAWLVAPRSIVKVD